jgi:hypothetical protein
MEQIKDENIRSAALRDIAIVQAKAGNINAALQTEKAIKQVGEGIRLVGYSGSGIRFPIIG